MRRSPLENLRTFLLILVSMCALQTSADELPPPDYNESVHPVLVKYCTGCHNAEDQEGDLSLDSFGEMMQGLEAGPVVLAGQADSSRLIRVLTGAAEPKMPPEGMDAPTAEEIELLRSWIDAGAKGPADAEPVRRLITPKIESKVGSIAISAIALSPDDRRLAIARFGRIEILESVLQEVALTIDQLPGKVNQLAFSPDGKYLVAATGVVGLFGQATVYDPNTGEVVREFKGHHKDTLYDAQLSPDGKLLATASYDRSIAIWNFETGEALRTITGHNGAVFDLAFNRDGSVLASASADETVKLWNVATGERLDTLGQPEGEQYTVAFSPDDKHIVAGGADNRIRVWRLVSRERPQINPLLHTRFVHEGAIVGLKFSPDGRTIVSTAADRTLKTMEATEFLGSRLLEEQSDVVSGLAVSASGSKFIVGRMNGTWEAYPLAAVKSPRNTAARSELVSTEGQEEVVTELKQHTEAEPNDTIAAANELALPAAVKGTLHARGDGQQQDADLFRFQARAGQSWFLEINAARSDSPVDSKIEILDADGNLVERVLLQAVRETYFTFRGKDSIQTRDYRLHNWEEIEINEYLYAAGEVVKLYRYPRGPDSGFDVYPDTGTRYTYFDTTPLTHALNSPCYVVRPYPPGTELIPNGLPTFKVYYENDDDRLRKWGTDSRLEFTAPKDGEYFVRVTDVRGFGGEDYNYELFVRHHKPDFNVTFKLAKDTIPAGGGREFTVTADRIDGFDGEIRVDVEGLPAGFFASSPVVIEAGHITAHGTINALPDASEPTAKETPHFTIRASAKVADQQVTKEIASKITQLKLGEKPKMLATILTAADDDEQQIGSPDKPLELTIAPGETIWAVVRVEREEGFDRRIPFGREAPGRNLPHGVYVDNMGLNGLMITQGKTQQKFAITAVSWVPETTRTFHLRAEVEGNVTTWPVILHVRQPDRVAQDSGAVR